MIKPSGWVRGLIILHSLVALAVGVGLCFFPLAFEASSGVLLPEAAPVLSETRSHGASLIGFAGLIFLGVYRLQWAAISALAASVLYLSYALGRVWSWGLDGFPGSALAQVMVLEAGLGLLGLVLWSKLREQISQVSA